jgi:hypothetical protein
MVSRREPPIQRFKNQSVRQAIQKIVMTATREFRTRSIRLYRISKEMCPHHPKPPALVEPITHDYCNFTSILR